MYFTDGDTLGNQVCMDFLELGSKDLIAKGEKLDRSVGDGTGDELDERLELRVAIEGAAPPHASCDGLARSHLRVVRVECNHGFVELAHKRDLVVLEPTGTVMQGIHCHDRRLSSPERVSAAVQNS